MKCSTHMMTAGLLLALVATQALAGGSTTTPLTTRGADAEEVSFGDLTTDALCFGAGATLALAPAVAFKAGDIPAGEVTLNAVKGLLYEPDEKWAVLRLTGAQLRAALERSVSFAPTPRVFFLQVSGLKMVYDPGAPRGMRVKSITVGANKLSDTDTYEVTMPASLAQGGSGYFTIFGNAPTVRSGSEGLAALIMRYVADQGSVSYTGQGRIVVGR